MTFSPFYMGNHVKPHDPSGYTMNENWGFQVNFMVPLDKRGLEQCRQIAARQEEKMRLNYELTRVLKCAELQQKGFMIRPDKGTGFYKLCQDVIPIASYLKTNEPPGKKRWSLNPFKK